MQTNCRQVAGLNRERKYQVIKIEPTVFHVAHWREDGLYIDAWCLDSAEAARLARYHTGTVERLRVPWPVFVPETSEPEAPW